MRPAATRRACIRRSCLPPVASAALSPRLGRAGLARRLWRNRLEQRISILLRTGMRAQRRAHFVCHRPSQHRTAADRAGGHKSRNASTSRQSSPATIFGARVFRRPMPVPILRRLRCARSPRRTILSSRAGRSGRRARTTPIACSPWSAQIRPANRRKASRSC